MKRHLSPILAFSFLAIFPAGAFAEGDPAKAAATVILDESGVKNLKIETVEAEETTFEETVFALGRIRVAPGHRAVVSSRIPGRVVSVGAHIDTQVEKGAEVVVIESRQPGDPPPSVRLTAPISGLVSVVSVAQGQPVEPSDSIMEIVDLKEVHAAASVPEHLAGKLKPGQAAHIRVAAVPGRVFEAKLAHLGVEADSKSGTLEAAFHVDNPEGLLRPGMRAEFSIVLGQRENVMSVPRSVLQGDATNRFVYVADYELKNAFVKTPVVVGAINDRFVEITSGLFPGDMVVTNGAYSLAFAGKGSVSLKEALDAAHGHEHNEDGSEVTAAQKSKGDAHDHAHDSHFNKLTILFAATTGILLVLLVIASRRQPPAAS